MNPTREPARFAPGEKRLVMEGVATPADRAASPYMYLPFVVPEGTETITVRYSYDERGVIDIGMVDPEIEPFPARRGFRGWSGSARREFFITRDAATPGYVPGAIQPGVWQVILGLHRIPADGCPYRVEVVLDEPVPARAEDGEAGGASPGTSVGGSLGSLGWLLDAGEPDDAATGQALAEFRRLSGKAWRRGDLHSHTYHSDAKGSPEALVAAARARGLDFLAITDHNTASHHAFLGALQRPDFLVIPGEEITTDRGHTNVWGINGWVDFRLLSDADVELLVKEAHARGGLISVNHPKQGGPPWTYPIVDGFDCFEAWQMLWPIHNREALDLYDSLLRQGRRLTLVGGSDWHHPADYAGPSGSAWTEGYNIGHPTTWLDLNELTVGAVLDALRRGAAFVSEAPAGPMVQVRVGGVDMGGSLTVRPGETPVVEALIVGAKGDRVRWIGSSGVLREADIETDVFFDRWELEEPTGYVRLEVYRRFGESGPDGPVERVRALSNPVYIVHAGA
ncbi:MAG TPA: CehA/McbA family metallohydrolase [Limnochordales bacterium]